MASVDFSAVSPPTLAAHSAASGGARIIPDSSRSFCVKDLAGKLRRYINAYSANARAVMAMGYVSGS